MTKKLPNFRWRSAPHVLATGFGSGLSPIAPGTMGTIAAIPFYLVVFAHVPTWLYAILLVLSFGFGVLWCHSSGKDFGVADHGSIVWDEMVGYWLTAIVVSWHELPFYPWGLWAFVWFRLFDIVKPWPINLVDRQTRGGFGVMFDDILAAIYAGLVLELMISVF